MHFPQDLLCPHQQPFLVNRTFTVSNWNGVWRRGGGGGLLFFCAQNPFILFRHQIDTQHTPDIAHSHLVQWEPLGCGNCYFVKQSGHMWQAFKISQLEHVPWEKPLQAPPPLKPCWPSPVDWYFYYVKVKDAYTGMFLHRNSFVMNWVIFSLKSATPSQK